MADRKACAACKETKVLGDFEKTPTRAGTRSECKACRSAKRKAAADAASKLHVPEKTPKPAACSDCGKGPEEVAFKWRTDVKAGGWRSSCNDCYNAKGYTKAYRERERSKDEVAYLARNALTHLEWARRNPDKVAEQQAKSACEPERRIKQIRTSAAARLIPFEDADGEAMASKLREPCLYCSYAPAAGEPLNGLDRIDVRVGYTDANTAPCCATCNAMKGPADLDVFVDNVRRISAHAGDSDGTISDGRTRLPAFGGRAELRSAPPKEKRWELTDEEEVELLSSPCYLCGRAPAFGIDRVDADGDYTPGNSRPCCTDCNYMKKDVSLLDFKRHVAFIQAHTVAWVIRDVTDAPFKVLGGNVREPVSAEGFDVIFPSIATAAKIVRASSSTLEDAVRNSRACRGVKWTRRECREYRLQHVPAAATRAAIVALRRRWECPARGGSCICQAPPGLVRIG